jgi:hypothetical protein
VDAEALSTIAPHVFEDAPLSDPPPAVRLLAADASLTKAQ